MNHEMHALAEQLIAKERVEGLAPSEREWLAGHLRECANCAEHARLTADALRSLRTAVIALPDGLASRTQFRVRLRAQELREREPKRRALWLTCAISWIFGVASAPYVWNLFQWFGRRAGLPKLVWELGFGLWWATPALFFVVVVLIEAMRRGSEPDWTRQSR